MPVQLAYISVVLIWSSTPLAIKFSNDSVSPIAALTLRILVALLVALPVALLWQRRLLRARNWALYSVAAIGIFPNMLLVYLAATYINSGLVSILFGLVPFFNAVFSTLLLQDAFLSRRQVIALLLSLTGLAVVFMGQLNLGDDAYIGVLLMLGSNLLFSISSVGTKRLSQGNDIGPVEQTVGAMAMAVPGLLLSWYWLDGELPTDMGVVSTAAIGYLALCGSVLGFVAYFFILAQLSVATVSLIPLVTPILAVCWGAWLGGENLTPDTLLGGALVVLALAIYQGLSLQPAISRGVRQVKCLVYRRGH